MLVYIFYEGHTITYTVNFFGRKKGNAILYPATSVPFDNSNIMLNPLVNIKKTSNKNLKSNKPYDIVLTNVDENNYNLVYPNSTLLPFYKFSPDSYYLTNSKKDILISFL